MNEKGISVLEEYELEVLSIRKGRGMLLVETDKGVKKLVELKGTETHAEFQNTVQEQLLVKEGIKTDNFIRNKEGELFTTDKDNRKYALKEHIEGEECDIKNQQDVALMVKNLARLHKTMELSGCMELKEETYQQDIMKKELEKHNKELRKIRSYIRSRSSISIFETKFLKEFEGFYEEGEKALELLQGSAYKSLCDQSLETGTICHGDYNYHNVIFEKRTVSTINFEKCHVGIQMEDLYHFMRKILEKNNWDKKMGRKMLEEYRSVRRISQEEQENLYIRLMYPEKFWKLANQYYNSNKAWISNKTIEKLETVVMQNEKKREFLKEFMKM